MEQKKLKLKRVRIEDFDVEALRRAAREGRLFIAHGEGASPTSCGTGDETAAARRERSVAEIHSYVDRISEYSTTSHVHEIWERILSDDRLSPLFFFTRYTKNRGLVNWYRVTAVVCLLRDNGVYRNDITAVRLHQQLEGSNRRNNRYTGMGRYLLDHGQILIVRGIIKEMR